LIDSPFCDFILLFGWSQLIHYLFHTYHATCTNTIHSCQNIAVYLAKLFVVGGVVLSTMSLMGCMFFSLRCDSSSSSSSNNNNNNSCFEDENGYDLYQYSPQRNYGLFTYDLSPSSTDVKVANGACVWYTNDTAPPFTTDGTFTTARAMAITGLCCGVMTTLLLFGSNVCCDSKLHMCSTSFFGMCACLFQALTLFMLTQQNSTTTDNDDADGTYAVFGVTAYLCVASATCYFFAMAYSCVAILCAGGNRNRGDDGDSDEEREENIHDQNNNQDTVEHHGHGHGDQKGVGYDEEGDHIGISTSVSHNEAHAQNDGYDQGRQSFE
jgi:hypothetical protein